MKIKAFDIDGFVFEWFVDMSDLIDEREHFFSIGNESLKNLLNSQSVEQFEIFN